MLINSETRSRIDVAKIRTAGIHDKVEDIKIAVNIGDETITNDVIGEKIAYEAERVELGCSSCCYPRHRISVTQYRSVFTSQLKMFCFESFSLMRNYYLTEISSTYIWTGGYITFFLIFLLLLVLGVLLMASGFIEGGGAIFAISFVALGVWLLQVYCLKDSLVGAKFRWPVTSYPIEDSILLNVNAGQVAYRILTKAVCAEDGYCPHPTTLTKEEKIDRGGGNFDLFDSEKLMYVADGSSDIENSPIGLLFKKSVFLGVTNQRVILQSNTKVACLDFEDFETWYKVKDVSAVYVGTDAAVQLLVFASFNLFLGIVLLSAGLFGAGGFIFAFGILAIIVWIFRILQRSSTLTLKIARGKYTEDVVIRTGKAMTVMMTLLQNHAFKWRKPGVPSRPKHHTNFASSFEKNVSKESDGRVRTASTGPIGR
mmetsp:Transcript_3547/g.4820  ORF Transcript_3547/g.4820 Transcript_3547/m.4820 type:complete len:427 (+) Transcript_3547:2-1282(+)